MPAAPTGVPGYVLRIVRGLGVTGAQLPGRPHYSGRLFPRRSSMTACFVVSRPSWLPEACRVSPSCPHFATQIDHADATQWRAGRVSAARAEGVGFGPTMSVTTHSGFKTACAPGATGPPASADAGARGPGPRRHPAYIPCRSAAPSRWQYEPQSVSRAVDLGQPPPPRGHTSQATSMASRPDLGRCGSYLGMSRVRVKRRLCKRGDARP
jgi:hypothetical protein